MRLHRGHKRAPVHGVINHELAPYSWYEDGAYHGILCDVARLLIARSGLSAEFIGVRDRVAYQLSVEEGAAALRFDMDSLYNQAEKEHYWLTSPYITVPLTRLVREDTTRCETVAVPSKSSTAEDLESDMAEEGIGVVYYDSVAEAVQAVMDGKQDMAYLAEDSAKRAGANLFLSKPVFQLSLFDLLMTLTDGKVARMKVETKNWDFASRRVLLAEDNALNQTVAKGYIDKCHVVVNTAADRQTAMDKFLAAEPGYYDAVLMDIKMPNLDGFEATRAIRGSGHPAAKTVQITAQTADAFNEDITKTLSAGMNAHVSKPIKPELLAKALHRAFAANGSGKPAGTEKGKADHV